MPAMDLPPEIIEQILVSLPAISLLRFTLVCKQWRSLISDPNFVRKHLNRVLLDRSNNHHHKLIVNSSPKFYSINCESHNSTKRHFPLQSPSHDIRIMGSCNGLLLVGLFNQDSYCDSLLLWNPLLGGEYNNLPKCSSILGTVRLPGFGYDSSANDYKVVRLIAGSGDYGCGDYGPINCMVHRVEIYSLKTNSWKSIQGVPFDNVFIHYKVDGGTLVNGSIHWLVSNTHNMDEDDEEYEEDNGTDNLILAFDLIDEKFRLLVGAPPAKYIDPKSGRGLVDVRGCLGLYQAEYILCDVPMWILREDENKNECWSKFMRIPKGYNMYAQPAFFMKDDQVLLSVIGDKSRKKDKVLVVYDSKNMKFRALTAFGTSVWSEQMIYVETLVSPIGGRRGGLE